MTVVKKLIYIISGDNETTEIIKAVLKSEGFLVKTFADDRSAFSAFGETAPDLTIIDADSNKFEGRAFCSFLRLKSGLPIILISALGSEADIIAGLTFGCDDYIVKPYSPLLLLARVKSLLRRIELDIGASFVGDLTEVSDIKLDKLKRQAFLGTSAIPLTAMEFALLSYLADNRGRSVSRRELLDKVWGFENEVETRATDDMMKRVRRKLHDAGSALEIETVRSFGFRIM